MDMKSASAIHFSQYLTLLKELNANVRELVVYDAEANSRCGDATCRIAAPIELTSRYQWSGSARATNRRVYFDFRLGSQLAPRLRSTLTRRALCTSRERELGARPKTKSWGSATTQVKP